MTQSLAYEIGGVFLLAALLIGVSFARGLFSADTIKTVRIAAVVLGAVTLGITTYNLIPDLAGARNLPSVSVPPPAPPPAETQAPTKTGKPLERLRQSPQAPRQSPQVRDVEYVVKVEPEPEAAPAVEEQRPANAAVASADPVAPAAAAPEESDPPNSPSRGKRFIKSIGRILHIGHKKQDP